MGIVLLVKSIRWLWPFAGLFKRGSWSFADLSGHLHLVPLLLRANEGLLVPSDRLMKQ